MYVNLSGLNVLVTGSSRGIGKAIAQKMAEAGATVAVHYNKSAREAENLAYLLGNQSKSFQADLQDPKEAAKLFERVILEMGSIEILINNAGIYFPSPLEKKETEWLADWNLAMNINLHSPALLIKKAVEHWMKRKSGGRIINITSRAAFKGDGQEYLSYAAAKAGMVAITKSIAKNYGKAGIKTFALAPGFVRTDMIKENLEKNGEPSIASEIALDRLTEPRDIAPLVTFLASGMSDHATGTTIDLNAGSYMH